MVLVCLEVQLHQSTRYPLKGVALKNSYGVLSGLLQLGSYSSLVLEHLSRIEELAKGLVCKKKYNQVWTRPPNSPTLRVLMKPKLSLRKLFIIFATPRGSLVWEESFLRVCCFSVLQGQGRLCLRGPLQEKLECPSSPAAAVNSKRCLLGLEPGE
uniref:Uncharacterized protein n=1 Tax=Brassica oleracea TaxID=3712 RepID=A0A3P6GDV9_BRAOL|nr:unnamed protein product [Brassica oleracea]